MSFTPRLSAPSTTDKYWISTGSGGYNRCIYITGNSVIPNCFAGDTEVLTSEGILNIKDCVGRKLKVFTIDGIWRDAEFQCFGEQALCEVGFGKHTYRCTANHRWPIFSQNFKFKQFVTTNELNTSMHIKYSLCNEIEYPEDVAAIRHGFIYGDGTNGYNGQYTCALLCGDKREYMSPYFRGMKQYNYADGTIDVPYQLADGKVLPAITCDKSYLYNFLKGYFAADGSVSELGDTINITCKDPEPLEHLRSICAVLCISTGSVKTRYSSGCTGWRPLSELSMYRTSLTPSFFLNPKHRQSYMLKSKKLVRQTSVKYVKHLDIVEPVYCAIEPVTHTFTLGGGELTGNCVGYAYGRFMEVMGTTSCNLSINNAENWWANTGDGYERGQTPKLGAVVCWRKGQAGNSGDGAGHVAIVEQINSDGSINTSNSAYGGTRFYTKLLQPPNYVMGSSYTFQGFIYNPNVSSSPNKVTEFLNAAMGHVGHNNGFVVSSVGISNNQPWSTSFITACALEVGVLNTLIPKVQDPGGFGRLGVLLGKGTWIAGPYTGAPATPEPGDILILRTQRNINYIDKYAGDRSAIVREVNGSVVHVVEGDCSGTVQLKSYTQDDTKISGYYRPSWSTVGGYSADSSLVSAGPLYNTKNTSEDATIREVGYLSSDYKPSISSTSNIPLSVINYTELLAAFFDSVVIRGSGGQDVITDGITNQNARAIMEFLLGKGLTAAQAIGFLANMKQESGFRPDAVNPSSGASGICQWLGGRKTAMVSFVGADWKSDLTGQCEFLWSELHGSESTTLTRVTQEVTANTEDGAKQATVIVLYQFERPGKDESVESRRCSNASELWSQIVIQMTGGSGTNNSVVDIADSNTSSGSIVVVPSSIAQTGIIGNYTYYDRSWSKTSVQYKLWSMWVSQGKPQNRRIATINGNYLCATTLKFGTTGDRITIVLEDGTTIPAILGDSKGDDPSHHGESGSQYGHYLSGKVDIIEWEALVSHPSEIDLTGWKGKKVSKIINHGSFL